MEGQVTVLLFAQAREAVGRPRVAVPVGTSGAPLSALLEQLTARHPKLAPVLPHCRVVLNGSYTTRRAVRVHAGDEVAIHPPYSGG